MEHKSSLALKSALLANLLLVVNLAQAHVVAEPKNVPADAYQKLTFRVTHGCEGSPTKAVTIYLPEAIHGTKPMPKAGWNINMEIKPLTHPYQSHGKLINEEARSITWNGGSLPNEYFDEFSIQVRTPSQPGQVAIPVTQICESGRIDWKEVATPGKTHDKLEFPAPVINVHSGNANMEHMEHHQH